jgi:hypothetical protein
VIDRNGSLGMAAAFYSTVYLRGSWPIIVSTAVDFRSKRVIEKRKEVVVAEHAPLAWGTQ